MHDLLEVLEVRLLVKPKTAYCRRIKLTAIEFFNFWSQGRPGAIAAQWTPPKREPLGITFKAASMQAEKTSTLVMSALK